MTPQEKILYHQIHPLKLATDISVEIVSSYFFWKHKLLAGLLVLLPSGIASTLVMRLADLEKYKQSAFGRYIRTYMTPSVVAMRLLGTVITHLGAWYRKPALILLGWLIVLLGWLRGIILPGRREQ
jgi:uncharacterized membrane protein